MGGYNRVSKGILSRLTKSIGPPSTKSLEGLFPVWSFRVPKSGASKGP